jgi:ABC-2 type transport system ATP-binding protein
MATATGIEIRDVRHAFGGREVLAGVSLSIAPGAVFGLLGANGSGKSTLLGLVAGLLPLQAGTITLQGEPVTGLSTATRARIGVLFQGPSLDGKLTARENLKLAALVQQVGSPDAAIARALDTARLTERADDKVETFSGGMRRRLDLSRALLSGPSVMLLDEPSAGLDEASFRAVWARLDEERTARGLTVMVATHRPDEAARCDRLAVVAQGRIVTIATPDELTAQLASDVIEVRTPAADEARRRFATAFPMLRARLCSDEKEGAAVHLECNDGHKLIAAVVESLAGLPINAVQLRRASLADAFAGLTGEALDPDTRAQPVPALKARGTAHTLADDEVQR